MDKSFESLIRINKDKAKPAVKALSNAFRDYPLLQFYFPDNLTREKIANYFLSFAVYTGIKYGEVYATSNNLSPYTYLYLSPYTRTRTQNYLSYGINEKHLDRNGFMLC